MSGEGPPKEANTINLMGKLEKIMSIHYILILFFTWAVLADRDLRSTDMGHDTDTQIFKIYIYTPYVESTLCWKTPTRKRTRHVLDT